MKTLWLLSLFCFLITMLSVGRAQEVKAVYVFGDSLVDVGNNNHLKVSLAKANFPHNGIDFPGQKATGRFSNGKNAADFLAEKLGLPTSPPYLSLIKMKNATFLSGVSFASAGAGIFNGTDDELRQSIPLTKQVGYFSLVHDALVQQLGPAAANQHLSKSLFPIVIGSNDIFGHFKSSYKPSNTTTSQQYVDLMVTTFNSLLKRIYDLGARKFLIVGIGSIGCCPSQRVENKTQVCNQVQNYWASKYNDGLKASLGQLQSKLNGFQYSYFDTFSIFSNFIQKPADYGFSEVKAACCGLGTLNAKVPCLPIAKYCQNRSDHVFWDLYHPTEQAARLLVDIIFGGSKEYVIPMNLRQLVAV